MKQLTLKNLLISTHKNENTDTHAVTEKHMVQFTDKPTKTVLDGLYMLRSLFQFHEMFVSLFIEGRRQRCQTPPLYELKNEQNLEILAKFEIIFLGGSVYTVKV